MTDPSRVRISGPLRPFLSGFATDLARQGYTPRSLLTQLNLLAHVSRWLHARDRDVGDLPERTKQFLEARQDAGYKGLLTGKALRPFLRRCVSADGFALDFTALGEADVTAFLVTCCAEQSPKATQRTATALRSLLRFLHLTGAVTQSLAAAVPSVAGRRLAGLPPRLEPDHVQRLLAVCDRRTLGGRRDFAVITTLARLGLRAAEVAPLRLDDLRWRTSTPTTTSRPCSPPRPGCTPHIGERRIEPCSVCWW